MTEGHEPASTACEPEVSEASTRSKSFELSNLEACSIANHVWDRDVWALLVRRKLLGPRLRIWYSFVLKSRIFLMFVGLSALGLAYLAVFPDESMSEAYGEKLARTICCASSLYMLIAILRLVGARKVLELDSLRDHVEEFGQTANKHMQWSTWESHSGRLFDGSLFEKTRISAVILICGLAGLFLTGKKARPQTYVIWVTSGIVLQVLSHPTLFVTRVVQAISKASVLSVQKDIEQFPKDTISGDELFWQRMLDRYKHLDGALRNLWCTAVRLFLPHFGGLFLMGVCSITVGVETCHIWNKEAFKVCALSLFWSLQVTLRDVWVISSISSLCNKKSNFQDESIFAAALCKLGRNRMTVQQKRDHWKFLQAVELSPAGARIFLLVDTALLTRIAVPMITLDVTLISYILARLEISR